MNESRLIRLLRNLPLRRKLHLIVMGTSLLTMVLVMTVYALYEWGAVKQQLREDLSVRAKIIAANSTAALVFNDASAAFETIGALSGTPDVRWACIFRDAGDEAPKLFAYFTPTGSMQACRETDPQQIAPDSPGRMQIYRDIVLDGSPMGRIIIEADLTRLWNRLQSVAWFSLGVSLLVTLLATILSHLVERAIAEPMINLHQVMQQVANTGNYELRAPPAGTDEIGALVTGFNRMLAQVDERDSELLAAHASLEQKVEERDLAMAQLRSAQEQLVQAEKMASLGGLVAGVAHEINTPVGVANTAASTLRAHSYELKEAYAGGNIRRSMLERYVRQAIEVSDMIVQNLARASELIQSFKQVAVDQTSSERRSFLLHEYIDETMLSLKPRLKQLPYKIHVDCPDDITLDSYPGALSQVISNLVLNSVIHGFEGRDGGNIHIQARRADDRLNLSYRDDGVGMKTEDKKYIFDPFFTTKRGQGGSGLGMHIVFNLITRTLGGTIRMPPTEQGIAFDIQFPLRART